jgi:hypothetical protein
MSILRRPSGSVVSEAHRIRLAHLFDPVLAVHTYFGGEVKYTKRYLKQKSGTQGRIFHRRSYNKSCAQSYLLRATAASRPSRPQRLASATPARRKATESCPSSMRIVNRPLAYVLTGASKTGKSAIIDIVDYCTGRSECNVADGVIRKHVGWYAILFQLREGQIFIARRNPELGEKTSPDI